VSAHYHFMAYSYLGLLAAAVSEAATRLPMFRPAPGQGFVFGVAVAVATMSVFAVGGWLVMRNATRSLAPFAPPKTGATSAS